MDPEFKDDAAPDSDFLLDGEVSDRESSGNISSDREGKLPGTARGTCKLCTRPLRGVALSRLPVLRGPYER